VVHRTGALHSEAQSEERGRARKFDPPVVSSGNLTPFGKGERAIEFEDLAAAKMAFLVNKNWTMLAACVDIALPT